MSIKSTLGRLNVSLTVEKYIVVDISIELIYGLNPKVYTK